MINTVHIQHSAKSAGSAALRLNRAFLEAGLNSYIVSFQSSFNDTDRVIYAGRTSKYIASLNDRITSFLSRRNNKEYGLYTYSLLGSDVSKIEEIRKSDVIYLHWVQGGFLSLSSIRKILELNKPVVFFMHDMWSITGGCHYSFNCDKYKTRCGNCQVFSNQRDNDLSTKQFDKKQKLYSQFDNIYFIAPSLWMTKCAKDSSLARQKPVFNIPNIINEDIFKPVEKTFARKMFNISDKGLVIAFGAMSLNSPYKGWAYMKEALKVLKYNFNSNDITMLVFGSGFNSAIASDIPYNTRFLGYLNDEYSLALVYNAADVFVTPSLADNLPTTILESLSCSTPVVGFNVGGIPDMIRHKENGYIAEYKDAKDLANGIRFCIETKISGWLPDSFLKNNILEKHMDLFKTAGINLG